MNSKSELRIKAKKIRQSLNLSKISEAIIKKIKEFDLYKESKNVMIFYPLKDEINLLPLLNDNKNFYLPRVKDNKLEVCQYVLNDELCESCYHVLEPTCAPIKDIILDLVFVPALMVDKNNNRLGYGKGFYDRFLSELSQETKSIVVIPDELLVQKLPADKFDVPCDYVITQKKASFERG